MKLVSFLLALALSGGVAASAGAQPRFVATAGDLCSVAKGVASSLVSSGATITPKAGTSLTSLGRELQATYTHIKAAESVVLANSPGSLKPDFEKVFAFDNMVYSELSKAHWNVLVFAKSASSLEAGVTRIRPALLAIKAYFNKCKK
jgi:hypothetical protein